MTDQPQASPSSRRRRGVTGFAEIINGVVVIIACLCVTTLGLYRQLDATVVASVLTGAIGWAGGHALGTRIGAARAGDPNG